MYFSKKYLYGQYALNISHTKMHIMNKCRRLCSIWGLLSLMRIIEELLEWKNSGSGSRKSRLTAVGIHCADHATPSNYQKLALTSTRLEKQVNGLGCIVECTSPNGCKNSLHEAGYF
jgi:hypothetical protein